MILSHGSHHPPSNLPRWHLQTPEMNLTLWYKAGYPREGMYLGAGAPKTVALIWSRSNDRETLKNKAVHMRLVGAFSLFLSLATSWCSIGGLAKEKGCVRSTQLALNTPLKEAMGGFSTDDYVFITYGWSCLLTVEIRFCLFAYGWSSVSSLVLMVKNCLGLFTYDSPRPETGFGLSCLRFSHRK